jgi:ELWxxDGT repeat protein
MLFAPFARAEGQAERLTDLSLSGRNATFANLAAAGDTLYFQVRPFLSDFAPWQSSGTLASTGPVSYGTGLTSVGLPYDVGGKLLFFAGATTPSRQQLRVVGTPSDTSSVLKDNFELDSTVRGALGVLNGQLLFLVRNDAGGSDLWRSDGTPSGTTLVAPISPASSAFPYGAVVVGQSLFFAATGAGNVQQLWKTDGTLAGTSKIKDVAVGGGFPNGRIVAAGNTAYFVASEPATGRELWKSDGTATGTVLVRDINPGAAGAFDQFDQLEAAAVGGTLFFLTRADTTNGDKQLWKTDGTQGGTLRVTTKPLSSPGGGPSQLVAFGGALYFSAFGADTGLELWRSDGTEGGTDVLVDLFPGPTGSEPRELTLIDRTLYFRASSGASGSEVYSSNGTAAGTRLLIDLNPAGSSDPQSFTAAGAFIYFSADDGVNGRELWALPRPEVIEYLVYVPSVTR